MHYKSFYNKVLGAVMLLLAALSVSAKLPDSAKVIYLKSETIIPRANALQWLNNYINTQQQQPVQALVQFDKLPDGIQKQRLKAAGITLLDYIPDNAYIAIIQNYNPANATAAILPQSIMDMQPEWKTDKTLWEKAGPNSKAKLKVAISFFDFVAKEKRIAFLQQYGMTDIDTALQKLGIYTGTLPAKNLEAVAALYSIKYISPASQHIPLNFESQATTRVNIAQLSPQYGGYGLTGEGVTVGVGDNVSGHFHVDLKDRIINYNPRPYSNHGVHINGIAGGAGIVDPVGEGMAPRATLVNQIYDLIWTGTPTYFQDHNMTLTNNSYAAQIGNCNYAGVYDVYSEALDNIANDYETTLHVFAAGNDGKNDCPPYPIGFGTVTGAYQPAKNNIVVTSTDKRFVNATDGSRGPVKDGRLKPEITAVGVDVTSTTQVDGYLTSGGTSMATPEVTGALALVTERYKQLNSNSNPRADLLKALILNGTTDIGNEGPDYRFGFGFMNVKRTLEMLDSSRYFTGTVVNGAQQTTNITVPPNTAELKVMLCWWDPAASPISSKQLINDLDLSVLTPSAATKLPWVLDADPADILNPATEGVDRLNNTEQVVIKNPQAGNYTININGFNVPQGPQSFVVSYDFVPQGVSLTYPTAGATVRNDDSLRIYWDASDGTNSFTVEFSDNNGGSWTTLDNNVPADRRYYNWLVPANINSAQCLVRIRRNNTAEQSVSGQFVVNTKTEIQLNADQCPGYIAINWGAVPNATAYKVMMKMGAQLQPVDTVTVTGYVFSGLAYDSTYYVTVQPMFGNMLGYRSRAVSRKPNDGNCAGSISDGDLALDAVVNPESGRRFTSSALSNNETLTVRVHNLDDVTYSNYNIAYSINGSAWQLQNITTALPAGSITDINVASVNFSDTIIYRIDVAIENLTVNDPVSKNDTITKYIRHIANNPVNIANTFSEGFEAAGDIALTKDSIGFTDNGYWDFASATDSGRLRTFVNGDITIDGNRSVSMDLRYNMPAHQNYLTGTFNMTNYDVNVNEVRLEMDYMLHGIPQSLAGNEIWVRGSDNAPWQNIYVFDTTAADIGVVQNTGTLSVTDALLQSGQALTPSFQVRVGQLDSSLICLPNYGNGLTVDNVSLYVVQNDVQLVSITSPEYTSCGLVDKVPLTVLVKNGVSQTQNNILISYRLDNNPVVQETIPSIQGKDSIFYTFNQLLDISASGPHTLDVWIFATGDTYRDNDSLMNQQLRNQPRIATYPYLENFEDGDGYWYATGQNSSWEYGTPQAQKINKAASGTKAWVTNLDGNYNDRELSYLYSPCFDLSSLTNPVFSLSMAMDIENCGNIYCDAAFVQYSTDGKKWEVLGERGQGENWYNDTTFYVWNAQDDTTWKTAWIPIPKGLNEVTFRFVMSSDAGTTREGLGVDDIAIYEQELEIETNLVQVYPNPTRDGKLTIRWNANIGTEMQAVMTDMNGRVVYSNTTEATELRNTTQFETPDFANGVYILKLIIGDKKFYTKVVYL